MDADLEAEDASVLDACAIFTSHKEFMKRRQGARAGSKPAKGPKAKSSPAPPLPMGTFPPCPRWPDEPVSNIALRRLAYEQAVAVLDTNARDIIAATHDGVFAQVAAFLSAHVSADAAMPALKASTVTFGAEALALIPTAVVYAGPLAGLWGDVCSRCNDCVHLCVQA